MVIQDSRPKVKIRLTGNTERVPKVYSILDIDFYSFYKYQQMIQIWMKILSKFLILLKKQIVCFLHHSHFYIYNKRKMNETSLHGLSCPKCVLFPIECLVVITDVLLKGPGGPIAGVLFLPWRKWEELKTVQKLKVYMCVYVCVHIYILCSLLDSLNFWVFSSFIEK